MLKIITRALFFTFVFNAGVVLGGIYTPDIVKLAQSYVQDEPVEQGKKQDSNKPAPAKRKPSRTLVRSTV